VTSWRFTRAVARIAANIPYPDAQAAIDGTMENPLLETALKPLWACWRLLSKARAKRAPLELNLPEKRITLDAQGRVTGVAEREQLEAHRLVEDFMIAANVAAAKALEAKKSSLIYRAHEPPSREKLVALKEYLKTSTLILRWARGLSRKPSTGFWQRSSTKKSARKLWKRSSAARLRPIMARRMSDISACPWAATRILRRPFAVMPT